MQSDVTQATHYNLFTNNTLYSICVVCSKFFLTFTHEHKNNVILYAARKIFYDKIII